MSIIDDLKWRYAVKKFDSSKVLDSEQLKVLKEAVRLTPTSYGLQPFKVFNIENKELRKQLQSAAWGQTQIVDASHLFVFAASTAPANKIVSDYAKLKIETMNLKADAMKGYADFVTTKLEEKEDTLPSWCGQQTYIALGNLLTAAAELKVDACPMEGFEPSKVDEILGLKEKGYTSVVLATLGYRSEEDATASHPKVRKSEEQIFESL